MCWQAKINKYMYLKFLKSPIPEPYTVEGTTMTVPNLAPDLITIIEASINGQSMPLTSPPLYDDTPESGTARTMVSNATLGEIIEHGSQINSEFEEMAKVDEERVKRSTKKIESISENESNLQN